MPIDRSLQRRVAAVALTVGLSVAAACGSSDGGAVRTDAGQAPEGASAVDGLPVLPPVEERQPELFDDRGCVITGPGSADCSTTAGEIDAVAAGATETDDRALAGFVGSRWSEAVTGSPTVLSDTVTTGADAAGHWTARGLARNEAATSIPALEVRARLLGPDGAELAVATVVSPVEGVRSGEPVPFELVSDIDAASVAQVEWSGVASDAGGAERNLEVAVYWTRAAGDPEPVDLYLYRDAEGARPQLLFAGVTNRGDVAVPGPRLVVAWIDAAGVVAAVGGAPVVAPDASPLAELAPGAAADSMVVVAEPIPGGSMSDLVPIVWAMG